MPSLIRSPGHLVELALRDPELERLLDRADWYLVGSRATGWADELSDWDTIAIVGSDAAGATAPSRSALDRAFGVMRPAIAGAPTLAFHRDWRRSQGVEVEVMTPAAAADSDAVEHAFQLRHAMPLRLRAGVGERARLAVAERFSSRAELLACHAYEAFRRSRNEAVAALGRPPGGARILTLGACASFAARFWLLSRGRPYPSDKWLLAAVAESPDAVRISELLEAVLDPATDGGTVFDALWALWRIMDELAERVGVPAPLLRDSPFAGGNAADAS
ncbi:hypothetical protein ACFFGH_12965 [Lysobacter korlensis]|uniref:Polymerase nucleotidyl transferase domain-containing protein n=1 Tax=Lysobacter korlensis TaxID=553636 RepID=A0ABV6RP31_9GAMM